MSLFNELKRRNVFRVGIAYLIVGWLVVQVADVMIDNIGAPDWLFQGILLVLGIGFPLVLIFAWAFELTPEGLKRDSEVDPNRSIAPQTGRKLDRTIIVVLVLAVAYFIWESRFAEKGTEAVAVPGEQLAGDGNRQAVEAVPQQAAAAPAAGKADSRKSIVVLPFVNMSADPEQEYFSDGLSEELLNVLAKVKDLRVISRTSAFAFKGKDVSIADIAAQLDVTHVLEGSVRSAGDQVRITAQLIEVDTDSHLWSEAYNRKLENVFEIQAEISGAIARELEVTLGAGETRPTANLKAYKLFLRGRYHYQIRGIVDMRRAVDLLQQAVDLDPGFADAWANLAAASMVHSYYLEEGHEEYVAAAEIAARRAIGIDPDNGFAHAVLGLQHTRSLRWQDSFDELRLAIELNPNESNSLLWMAITLSELGYIEQAIDNLKRAESIDPVFTNLQNWLVNLYFCTGDFEAANVHRLNLLRIDPDYQVNFPGEYALVRGDLDLAETEALAAAQFEGSSEVATRALYTGLRDPGKKAESIATILAHETENSYTGVFGLLFRLGAVEEAIASWWRLRERGRTLRSANALSGLWTTYDRAQLSHPSLPAFFEETGMADYWRKHGDPDYCRVDGPNIECGTP